jgi:hypothetical protein
MPLSIGFSYTPPTESAVFQLGIDLSQDAVAGRQILGDKVCPGGEQLERSLFEEVFLFLDRKLAQRCGVESDHVTGSGQSDGPHAGVSALLDVADGVADFDAGGWRIDVERPVYTHWRRPG